MCCPVHHVPGQHCRAIAPPRAALPSSTDRPIRLVCPPTNQSSEPQRQRVPRKGPKTLVPPSILRRHRQYVVDGRRGHTTTVTVACRRAVRSSAGARCPPARRGYRRGPPCVPDFMKVESASIAMLVLDVGRAGNKDLRAAWRSVMGGILCGSLIRWLVEQVDDVSF